MRNGPKTLRRLYQLLCQWKLSIFCAAAGILLGAAVEYTQAGESENSAGELIRPGYGQAAQYQEVLVEGLEEEEIPVRIPVAGRRYTEEEALKVYEEILDQIAEWIEGENPSLQEVSQDLNLITELASYGVELNWKSEDPDRVSSMGKVNTQGLKEGETYEVWLEVTMTDGFYPQTFQFPVYLTGEVLSQEEVLLQDYYKLVEKQQEEQKYSPVLSLPKEYQGRPLSYRFQPESSGAVMVFLGIAAGGLLAARRRNSVQEEMKKRQNQLLMDYPEILSKMMIFLGAGMSIRKTMEQMAEDYQRLLSQKKIAVRYVYEEICETCRQMNSGVSEGRAYGAFGRRCGLPCYMKLCSLLEQNRKTGSKNLRNLLRLEMADAFEQQKHGARRMGEEAGTKLLVPLFLMLVVVMVMIVVPAWMDFA